MHNVMEGSINTIIKIKMRF